MIRKKKLTYSDFNPTILSKNVKENIFYKLLSNPNIYLKILLTRTLGIGLFTFSIWLFVEFFDLQNYTIPSTMHSLIGIVIGLLLVFRTNTAYDRWWDGRKIIASLSTEVTIISARIYSLPFVDVWGYSTSKSNILLAAEDFLINLKEYLCLNDDDINKTNSVEFHTKQKNILQTVFSNLSSFDDKVDTKNVLLSSFSKMMEYSNQLERIKNTPIPMSYVFHIKVSVLIYLITLPFGMFHDLGFAAIPLVMLIYYIIAGVEIISTEIENPFAGDPNDLPTDELFSNMIEILKT